MKNNHNQEPSNKTKCLLMKRLSNGSRLAMKGSWEEVKTASNKEVLKNTTTTVNRVFRFFFNCAHHSMEVDDHINTVQDIWCQARSEEQKCLDTIKC